MLHAVQQLHHVLHNVQQEGGCRVPPQLPTASQVDAKGAQELLPGVLPSTSDVLSCHRHLTSWLPRSLLCRDGVG